MDSSVLPIITTLTDEEFNVYHSTDRKLYKRLIINLGRDPAESMRVMAFWLWLEQEMKHDDHMSLINRMLTLPTPLINALAHEALLCLKCVETDTFPPFSSDHSRKGEVVSIALLPKMAGAKISLRYFHENRIRVLRGITRMMAEVCMRAFRDILENAFTINGKQFLGSGSWETVRNEVIDMFTSNLNVRGEENENNENEGSPDERTIFLTFSRGYPISEDQVWDFFTGKFGDFIEAIYMQEVGLGEQVLFARIIARSELASIIDAVVEGGRAKYSINGKHVWARKFLKKHKPPPPPSKP